VEDLPPASDAATIRVLIVDDHPLWRQTLRNVLEHAGVAAIVGEATGGAECVAKVVDLEPDVVLMDIELPDMRGTEATTELLARGVSSKIVVLSSRDERDTVLEAIRCGADGYLLKTADADEIADAIRRAHSGEAVFPPRLAKIVLDEIRQRSASEAR
jgi:DNA-binding NarL/FixJ family response regulator